MKILMYGINYSSELTGIGKYTGEVVEWMAQQGHDVRVIAALSYCPQWKVNSRHSSWRYRRKKGDTIIWRYPLYMPEQPSTLKRLLHLDSFTLSSLLPLLAQRRWKPDRIIGAVPTLFCTPGMCLLAKLSGTRTLLHTQDYKVDATLRLGVAGRGKCSAVTRLVNTSGRGGLLNMGHTSIISRSMINKAQKKGVDTQKVTFFPDWLEVARFHDVNDTDALALCQQLGSPDDKKVILYSGNIGEKRGLESMIDVVALLSEQPWLFVIVGQDENKVRLEDMSGKRSLNNVKFFPLQSYDALPTLFEVADCHLMVRKRDTADAILPPKLTNILTIDDNAAITTESETESNQLCDVHPGAAVCIELESVGTLVGGIQQALTIPKINTVAREYAERTLDKENVLSQFATSI